MKRGLLPIGWSLLLVVFAASPAEACSLYGIRRLARSPTLREEASSAALVLSGTIANPRHGDDGKGTTDFVLKEALREDRRIKTPRKIVLDVVLPVDDPKVPPHYLLFCDIDGKKVDPYRGVPIKGGVKTVEYVKKALALDPKKTPENLAFFFAHLDDADPEVARDAFLEFAKASDADILRAAPKLSAAKLRGWLKDPKTPAARLGVYALLLGACGRKEDGDYLRELLDSKDERYEGAVDGLMVGYIQCDAKAGWTLLHATLADSRQPILRRIGMLRALRFYSPTQPKESRTNVLKALRTVLHDVELADLAIEDLRGWKMWDLTDEVLARYGRKDYDGPIIKRAIIRYALCCKQTAATKAFVADRRKQESEVVEEVEDYLDLVNAK